MKNKITNPYLLTPDTEETVNKIFAFLDQLDTDAQTLWNALGIAYCSTVCSIYSINRSKEFLDLSEKVVKEVIRKKADIIDNMEK